MVTGLFPWQGFQHPETALPWRSLHVGRGEHTQPCRGTRARPPRGCQHPARATRRKGLGCRGSRAGGGKAPLGGGWKAGEGGGGGAFFQQGEAQQNRELRDKSSSFSFVKKE